jgi:hypothetical protein
MSNCTHISVVCLNEYELIRKYRCVDCAAVMMCSCDEARGRRFLPHQLANGAVLETQERVPVTAGFQNRVCRECKGLKQEAHPVSESWGRTSKIKRYYWRELWFRQQEIAAGMAVESAEDVEVSGVEGKAALARARALEEIKRLHASSPKYAFREESQDEVIRRHSVDVIRLDVTYIRTRATRAQLLLDGCAVTAEEYVIRHFQSSGYSVVKLESRPFHVLFGIYMWLLIQDPADSNNVLAGFAGRNPPNQPKGAEVWMYRPRDFGTTGYGKRRSAEIEAHLSSLEDLQWLFDYWLTPSRELRRYLWADEPHDVEAARLLVRILPAATIKLVLRYLVEAYWERYLGWPDLFAYRDGEFRLLEVKSSGDKLSEDQKRWIEDNAAKLTLPFSIVKLHRKSVVG